MNFVKKTSIPFRRFTIFVVSLTLFFVSASFVYGQVMRDRFLPGTRVAGIDVGGLSITEAKETLQAAFRVYEANGIRVSVGHEVAQATLRELGFSFNLDATFAQAFTHGRSSGLALPPLAHVRDVPLEVNANLSAQRTYLEALARTFSRPAIDATFTFENGDVALEPAVQGQNVVPPSLAHFARPLSVLEPILLSVAAQEVQPALTDDEVLALLPAVRQAIAHPVTVTTIGSEQTLSADTLKEWLTIVENDGKPELGFREGFVETALAPLTDLVFAAPKETFDFAATVRGEYALKNSEGRELDAGETVRRIVSVLDDPEERIVEVAIRAVPARTTLESVAAPIADGKVIVVDLSRQAVFAFENGRLEFWTRTSTGKGGYKTPTGQWKIYGKTRRQVMSGPGYYLPNVQWVLPYHGDYTLHGTYWHTDFGTPRSHGCTNLSNADAEWLYNWSDIGTPVIVTERLQ